MSSQPDLEREKWEYYKERNQEAQKIALLNLQQAWKYEYTKLLITVVVLIVLIILIWNFLQNQSTPKQTVKDNFAPYPSILANDTYRSDAAFDYSKPEVQLTSDSVAW